jgi:RimJ/RimL family protein N-acetyltransferase
MIEYEDKKVRLKGTDETDVSYAHSWRNDPKIRQWCRQYTDLSVSENRTWWDTLSTRRDVKFFGIETTKEGGSVGICGFTSINHVNQNAEFSLYIDPEDHGSGYGKDALYTLVRHGFEDFNFHRIWGEVFEGNHAKEMFKKLGFQEEGKLRDSYFREGRWIDSYIVGLIREDFVRLHGIKYD